VRDAFELGYLIFSAHRRRGYALEALTAAMSWAETNDARRFVVGLSKQHTLPCANWQSRACKIGEQIDREDGLEHIFLREGSGSSR
jgi:hypothetical protein